MLDLAGRPFLTPENHLRSYISPLQINTQFFFPQNDRRNFSQYATVIIRSTGPIAVARRRSVGRSVGRSVCPSTPLTRQPMFGYSLGEYL